MSHGYYQPYWINAEDELEHHGIKGQKWGIRRFQKEDGSLTAAGKKRYSKIAPMIKITDNPDSIIMKEYALGNSLLTASDKLRIGFQAREDALNYRITKPQTEKEKSAFNEKYPLSKNMEYAKTETKKANGVVVEKIAYRYGAKDISNFIDKNGPIGWSSSSHGYHTIMYDDPSTGSVTFLKVTSGKTGNFSDARSVYDDIYEKEIAPLYQDDYSNSWILDYDPFTANMRKEALKNPEKYSKSIDDVLTKTGSKKVSEIKTNNFSSKVKSIIKKVTTSIKTMTAKVSSLFKKK